MIVWSIDRCMGQRVFSLRFLFTSLISTCTMETRQRNFVTLFVLFSGCAIGYGDEPTPFYNENCPVPDLSEQCQAICVEKFSDCVVECGNDEVTG